MLKSSAKWGRKQAANHFGFYIQCCWTEGSANRDRKGSLSKVLQRPQRQDESSDIPYYSNAKALGQVPRVTDRLIQVSL